MKLFLVFIPALLLAQDPAQFITLTHATGAGGSSIKNTGTYPVLAVGLKEGPEADHIQWMDYCMAPMAPAEVRQVDFRPDATLAVAITTRGVQLYGGTTRKEITSLTDRYTTMHHEMQDWQKLARGNWQQFIDDARAGTSPLARVLYGNVNALTAVADKATLLKYIDHQAATQAACAQAAK